MSRLLMKPTFLNCKSGFFFPEFDFLDFSSLLKKLDLKLKFTFFYYFAYVY